MNGLNKILLIVTLGFLTLAVSAQSRITLEDIWQNPLPQQYVYGLHMIDGHRALKGEFRHGQYDLLVYDVPGWKVTDTLFSTARHADIRYVFDYRLSPGGRYLLLSVEQHPVYRYSSIDRYVLYDTQSDRIIEFEKDFIQVPAFSQDDKYVAYVKDNNLYLYNIATGNTRALTTDGSKNGIINGKSDWVYEEEFGLVQAYAFSRNGRYLAYLKFDQSEVPVYTMLEYDDSLYPRPVRIKYPKAGQPNARVGLHIIDLQSGRSEQIPLDHYEYLPRLQAGNSPEGFLVAAMNRLQNDLRIFRIRPHRSPALLYHETDSTYIDLERTGMPHFLPGGKFLILSERDGYNHLYLYNQHGRLLRQVTKGPWEITRFYGYDPQTKQVFFQSTKDGEIYRTLYRQKLYRRKPVRISPGTGYSSAQFTKDFRYFIRSYSSAGRPTEYAVASSATGRIIRPIEDNAAMRRWLETHGMVPKKFVCFPSADPHLMLNGWIMYPPAMDSTKKYPVLIYQYNGPGYQTVMDRWGGRNDLYHAMLAQNGIIVVSVDTRGTGGRGKAFRTLTYKRLGGPETEDLHRVGAYLASLPYVDGSRIGIWGWSYGGFMASNAILRAGDVFSTAIAVAPVTDWRFYDTVYTERYMQTPDDNPDGYELNAPLHYADELKGAFLLIHGTADDNVHVQNSYRLAKALQEAGKDFDMMIYPDKNHGIYGGQTRYQLYKRMYRFISLHLKK